MFRNLGFEVDARNLIHSGILYLILLNMSANSSSSVLCNNGLLRALVLIRCGNPQGGLFTHRRGSEQWQRISHGRRLVGIQSNLLYCRHKPKTNERSFFITKAAHLSHCQAQEHFLTRLLGFLYTKCVTWTHIGRSRPSVCSKFNRISYWTNFDDILSLYNIYSGEFSFRRMVVLLYSYVMIESSFVNFLKSAHHTNKIVNVYSVHLTGAFGRKNYKLHTSTLLKYL